MKKSDRFVISLTYIKLNHRRDTHRVSLLCSSHLLQRLWSPTPSLLLQSLIFLLLVHLVTMLLPLPHGLDLPRRAHRTPIWLQKFCWPVDQEKSARSGGQLHRHFTIPSRLDDSYNIFYVSEMASRPTRFFPAGTFVNMNSKKNTREYRTSRVFV